MQASAPISELLGSTPEETKQLKSLTDVKASAFKGVALWSKQKFEYLPLDEDERGYYTTLDVAEVFQPRRCNHCIVNFAEHKEVMTSIDLNGNEFNPDPNYKKYLCTECRDKVSQPKKKTEVRERVYHRYAGYHRSKPSLTPEEFKEQEAKYLEQLKRNAGSESESTESSSSSDAPANELANQTTS